MTLEITRYLNMFDKNFTHYAVKTLCEGTKRFFCHDGNQEGA